MSVGPDGPAAGADAVGGLGEADRVLLLALGPGPRPAGRGWAARRKVIPTRGSWPDSSRRGPGECSTASDGAGRPAPDGRAEARDRLREAHRAEARVDLARVHPSWLARGLREESPSVRRAVVAAAPEPVRSRVQAELLLDNDDLRAERPADPEVLAWACSLWTERLVGGEPRKADDPPVIAAMSGLSPRAGYRLCRYCRRNQARAGRPAPGGVGQRVRGVGRPGVRRDRPARHPFHPGREAAPARLPARIGLLTIARLLADCEPFRVRWALQHWPYAIAKLVRA